MNYATKEMGAGALNNNRINMFRWCKQVKINTASQRVKTPPCHAINKYSTHKINLENKTSAESLIILICTEIG